jgi:MraZ protein
MLSFIGEYICRADIKFRVVVPSSFRKQMMSARQATFILRKNIFEECLDVYPLNEWEAMVEALKLKLNLFDRTQAAFFRAFYAGAQEVEMDASGRILLPKRLLEEVKVEKEMMFSGQGSKIEIWNNEVYERLRMSGDGFAEMTQEVLGK